MGIPPAGASRSETLFESENGTIAMSMSTSTSMQRRRRKQEDTSAINDNNNVQKGTNEHNIDTDSSGKNGQRSTWKRKIFRGDRKKVVVKSVIAFFLLYVWISICRFEFRNLDARHTDNNPIINTSTLSKSTLPNGSQNEVSKSKGYDSIFCRAGSNSFQQSREISGAASSPTKPVFLWGIPSTTSKFEVGRRDLLRKTYLDFFRQIQSDKNYQRKKANAHNETTTALLDTETNLICSLHEWTCNTKVRADCQMIYVFFVGGHDSIDGMEKQDRPSKHSSNHPPPILLNETITDFRDMLIPPNKNAKDFDLKEPGTVYLNIRENQFDGKMPTWFKFASLVAQEYNSAPIIPFAKPIEYIFKVDSDLMLLTPHFLRWFDGVHTEQQLQQGLSPTKATRKDKQQGSLAPLVKHVYGGIEFPATNCVENFTFDHPCPLPLSGPSYMSGELNFMSVDLATYVASDDCPRDQWTIPHEDVSLSNYVYSYTNNTGYHKREQHGQTNNSRNSDADHSIHIVSVNTSSVLLLPNMKANWEMVSLRKNPDLLRTGELLWGHSIKRGNHTRYLYWKTDKKFASFWKLFIKAYTTTGKLASSTNTKSKAKMEGKDEKKPLSKIQFALLQKQAQEKNVQEKGKIRGR